MLLVIGPVADGPDGFVWQSPRPRFGSVARSAPSRPLTVALGFLLPKRFRAHASRALSAQARQTLQDWSWSATWHALICISSPLSTFKNPHWLPLVGFDWMEWLFLIFFFFAALGLRPVDDLLPAARLRHRHRRRRAHPHAHRDLRNPLLGKYSLSLQSWVIFQPEFIQPWSRSGLCGWNLMFFQLSKRRRRKDLSTTGSSIYSGPYTNTAYSSHSS